jgi:hypothetical protein
VAVPRKITFDILGQTGNLLDIQKAFASQARAEGWKPHEIVGYISASMEKKSLYPMAQCCEGISEEALETLRAEYCDPVPDPAAARGPASNVVIVGLDIPFNAMVELLLKWALAAIPAVIVLFTVCFTLNYVYTAFVLASRHH